MLTYLLKRNALLTWASVSLLALTALMLPLLWADDTLVMGINRWIKPIKFCLSVIIYLLTLAWISVYLPARWMNAIAKQVILCMVIEIGLIIFQAARGQRSHFNRENALGIAIYAFMGFFVLYNTVLVFLITLKFYTHSIGLPPNLLLGIQLGLITFLIGSLAGGYMSAQMGHTVGAPDGGVGLPFLNWSVTQGDLRVAHFIGLHGIQVLILLGYWSRQARRRSAVLVAAFCAINLVVLLTFWQAIQGQPFVIIP